MTTLTPSTIEALRAEIEQRMDAKIQEARREAAEAHKALDVVAGLLGDAGTGMNGSYAARTVVRHPKRKKDAARRVFPTAQWVAEVVAELPLGVEITQPLIYDKLIDRHPELRQRTEKSLRGQIPTILNKLHIGKKLKIKQHGFGQDPNVYVKTTEGEQN